MRDSRIVVVVALATLLMASAVSYGGATCKDCSESDSLCGPICLQVVCQKLGIAATVSELEALSGCESRAGTTLLGLQKAAKAKGLQAVAMKISVADLAKFKGQAIAHEWGDHFVVVEPANGDLITVTDPPAAPLPVPQSEFQKVHSGFALLIAEDIGTFPNPKDEGPSIVFDSYRWDFGGVLEGESRSHTFVCRNTGSSSLSISSADTSCQDCLILLDYPRTIPVGGTGEIRVLVKTEKQEREISKRLYVTSNDPISPRVQLDVTGYVRPAKLAFWPRGFRLGTVRQADSASADVYIPVWVEDGFAVRSVKPDSPFLDASLTRSSIRERPGYIITASLKPGAPVGELNAKITVISDHPKQPKVEIPITATIKGNIDLDRDSFFLGLVKKGKGAASSVTVSTVGSDPLKITKIDNPLACVTTDVKPNAEGKHYVVTASLKPDAPLGNIKGDIVLHTNDKDQPEIKIPVYAYVED